MSGPGFDPSKHIINVRGKEYLEVKFRLVWLRDDHPDWGVETELLSTGDPVIARATIRDETGRVIATGLAEYERGKQFPAVMKAETAALGRALAHAGYGTQFAGDDLDEAGVVDAPRARGPAGGAPGRAKSEGKSNQKGRTPAPTQSKVAPRPADPQTVLGWIRTRAETNARDGDGPPEATSLQLLVDKLGEVWAGADEGAPATLLMAAFPGTTDLSRAQVDAVLSWLLPGEQDPNTGDFVIDPRAAAEARAIVEAAHRSPAPAASREETLL